MARFTAPVILAVLAGALVIFMGKLRSNRQLIRRLKAAGAVCELASTP